MKKSLISSLLVGVSLITLAQQSNSRIITITGGERSGPLKQGPLVYSKSVVGKVQNLVISAPKATLSAPKNVDLADAEGKRTALFEGGVEAKRDRLTANGPSLKYLEETGVGLLSGPTKAVQKPKDPKDDDVIITAKQVEFDVDAKVSTSTGDVKLVNGKQTAQADTSVYYEDIDLGIMKGSTPVSLIREPSEKSKYKLTIVAKEARVLTEKNFLLATGGITLVSGDNKTTGDSLYFNDETGVAIIVGKPAKNVNSKSGATITGATIENYTDKNQVKQFGSTRALPVNDFKAPGEK